MDTNELISETVACGICGENHKSSNCTYLEIKHYVPDSVIPSKARLTLPQTLKIENMADGYPAVVSLSTIKKGTQFGPFMAQKLFTLKPDILFPLKIFNTDAEDFSEHYFDTSNEDECNWLFFVNPANSEDEQNLICYQDNQDIYYSSSRDIQKGEVLKVWYAPYYAARMKKSVLKKKITEETPNALENIHLDKLLTKQQNIIERENWVCKFCDAVENNVIKFSKHILEHYSLQLKKVCEICREAFATRKGLKKHLKIVHSNILVTSTESKTDKLNARKQTEVRKTKDLVIGGPLLNDILADSMDNSNMLLTQMELNSFDISVMGNQSSLLESENLSVDNLLNENVKQLDHFNFEIDESQEQFVCDVCLKSFTKLRLLVQHLKKHTGKFTCHQCFKVFCRNENLKTHDCTNTKPQNFKCNSCQKFFSQSKYLSRHIQITHTKKYECKKCDKFYHSSKELKEHNCPGIPDSEKQTFSCTVCNKIFLRDTYLKNHMKIHFEQNGTNNELKKPFICEICAQRFITKHSLQNHLKIHEAPSFNCDICDKKFHKKSVLQDHILTHGEAKFKCPECDKMFKLKKYLQIHQRLHRNNRKHQCPNCPRAFYDRTSLIKHQNSIHNKTCRICNKEFPTLELKNKHTLEHSSTYYSCNFCDTTVKLKGSLLRHIKRKHLIEVKDLDLDRIKSHSEEQLEKPDALSAYDGMEFENLSFENNTECNAKERSCELDFNDLEIELGSQFDLQQSITDEDISLSMPNLANEQELTTFSHNAYIFQNQNDEVLQEQGKVVVYVLDQKFL